VDFAGSTALGIMAKEENWQTSSWVMPKLSQSNVAFRDITWDPVNKQCATSVFDSECLARINSSDDSLVILFELNTLYRRTSTGEKSEVSCGWCVVRLFEENGAPVPNNKQ